MDIKSIINEELKTLFENLEVYTIPQLAQLMNTRMQHPESSTRIYQRMLQDAYRKGGDQAVIDMYTKLAGVQIEALRNGRYVFASLSGGGENQLEEVEDNANHTPDEMPS